MDSNIFATRLIKARRLSGLSLDELSEISLISKPAISKYENAQRMPDSSNIIKLSKALKVDMDFFFSNPSGDEIQVEAISNWTLFHREEYKVKQDDISIIKNQTADFLERYFELEKISSSKVEFKNPVEDLTISNKHDAEKAAKKVRKSWKLGNLPLKNIVNTLENKGVKIFQVENYEFEGFAAWAGTIPIIVLNTNKTKEITRLRFTALHELAHLVLKLSSELVDENTIEKICDAFASEVLIPIEVLRDEIGNKRTRVSMSELRNIKTLYGVSIMSIMTKAVIHGIIDPPTYNLWKHHYNEMYLDGTEDFGSYTGTEQSMRFNQLLHKSLIEEKLSINKAASISKISVNQLKKEILFNNEIYG